MYCYFIAVHTRRSSDLVNVLLIPGRTSYALTMCVYDRLLDLRRDSIEIFGGSERTASLSPVSTFSTAIGARLPDNAAVSLLILP